MKNPHDKEFDKALKKHLNNFLNNYVIKPSNETIKKDFILQDRLSTVLYVVTISKEIVFEKEIDVDDDYLLTMSIEEREDCLKTLYYFLDTDEKNNKDPKIIKALKYLQQAKPLKYLYSYLDREITWIVVSIFSASYISANVLLRSSFELLIGLSTRKSGKMNDRIDSISFITDEYKASLKQLWKELCKWSHPYGKWEKEVCPVFFNNMPMYHPALSDKSVINLEKIINFLLLICIDKFNIDKDIILNKLNSCDADITRFDCLTN